MVQAAINPQDLPYAAMAQRMEAQAEAVMSSPNPELEAWTGAASAVQLRRPQNLQHGLVFSRPQANNQILMAPLKKVQVNAVLEGALANVKVSMHYFNPHADSPIECTYELPLELRTLVASL